MSQGQAPPKALGEGPSSPLPATASCQQSSVPGLTDASFQPLPQGCVAFPGSNLPSSCKDVSHCSRVHASPARPPLGLIPSANTLFQMRAQHRHLGTGTWTVFFGEQFSLYNNKGCGVCHSSVSSKVHRLWRDSFHVGQAVPKAAAELQATA